jgi:hypothetical protein
MCEAIKHSLISTRLFSPSGWTRLAISEEAKKFYLSYGFQASSIEPMTLLLSVQHLKNYFGDKPL